MSEQVYCNHVFTSVKKNGDICGRKCRGSGFDGKCCYHKIHACTRCDFTSVGSGNMAAHESAVHDKIKGYKCPSCEKTFTSRSKSTRHVNSVHLKIKPHGCTLCDYAGTTKGELLNHQKFVHEKIKTHKCPICDILFSRNGDLTTHIKATHEKIKNYHCNICDYSCSKSNNLQAHIDVVHNNARNFHCTDCDYTSTSSGNLRKHFRAVHLNIREYQCPTCPQQCSSNGDLQRHIIICTEGDNCSSGEFQIKKALNGMKIPYHHDSQFELKNLNDNWLKWDFKIDTRDIAGPPEDNLVFIEYNGRHHYESVDFFGGEEFLATQQLHDALKDEYCCLRGYPILWIHYKDYGRIAELVTDFITENTNWGFEMKKIEP